MSSLRYAAAVATDLACRTVGRRNVVRSSRFVFRRACLDIPNDMRTNGEKWLQQRVVDLSPSGVGISVVDVGANIGRWSLAMITAVQRSGRSSDLDLHAFEPSSYTFRLLSETLSDRQVTLNQAALCERKGVSVLHLIAPGAGRNSLHRPDGADFGVTSEAVPTVTLDEYASDYGLARLALVKIDTEGHDLAVLRGAGGLLAERRIGIVQFEYNHRWVYARSFLRDAFDLLEPLGYLLGKLTPRGVEFYPGWDPDLETFVEGNYIACTRSAAEKLSPVRWWKSVGEPFGHLRPGSV